jgi:hypothetical protein
MTTYFIDGRSEMKLDQETRELTDVNPARRHKNRFYLNVDDKKELSLSLKREDLRSDGMMFNYYYARRRIACGRYFVRELWLSPESFQKQKENRADRKRKHMRKKTLSNRAFVTRVKRRYGCSSCGYSKCTDALHFHHIINENKRHISKMNQYGLQTLKQELRKCVVLCANCHAEEHYNERINNT